MPNDDTTMPANDPATPSPTKAPSPTDAEANRQMGGGSPPQAPDDGAAPQQSAGTDEARPPNVGAAHAPTSGDDVVEAADKTLYDRLADKDVSPVPQGGDT